MIPTDKEIIRKVGEAIHNPIFVTILMVIVTIIIAGILYWFVMKNI